MRSNGWLILLGFILISSNLRVSFSAASNRAPQPVRPAPRVVPRNEDVVDGYGPNAAAARERALDNAQKRVEKLVSQRLGGSGWKLAPEQLDPDYLARYGVVQEQGEPEPTQGANLEGAVVARYRVELTSDYLHEVQRLAHEQLVQERHLLLGRVLAGVVVLLLVLAGYLRLEDLTRGYATQLLRVSAIAVLGLTVAVLCLA